MAHSALSRTHLHVRLDRKLKLRCSARTRFHARDRVRRLGGGVIFHGCRLTSPSSFVQWHAKTRAELWLSPQVVRAPTWTRRTTTCPARLLLFVKRQFSHARLPRSDHWTPSDGYGDIDCSVEQERHAVWRIVIHPHMKFTDGTAFIQRRFNTTSQGTQTRLRVPTFRHWRPACTPRSSTRRPCRCR